MLEILLIVYVVSTLIVGAVLSLCLDKAEVGLDKNLADKGVVVTPQQRQLGSVLIVVTIVGMIVIPVINTIVMLNIAWVAGRLILQDIRFR